MDRVLRKLAEARPFDVPPRDRAQQSRKPSRKFILLPASALAAAVAIAAAFTLTGQSPVSTPPGDGAPVAKDARQVLLTAATQTSAAAQTTGRYWLRKTETGTVYDVGTYKILGRVALESWVPVSAQDSYVTCSQWLGFQPLAEADRATWQQAGSPGSLDVDHKQDAGPLTVEPGQRTCKTRPVGAQFNIGGGQHTYAEIQALPTDPAQLRTALGAKMEHTEPKLLFVAAIDVVTNVPAPAAVRSAAYRMLADVPGIGFESNVTDRLGRQASAVDLTFDNAGFVASKHRLIIDLATGQALAFEQRSVASGELTGYQAVTAFSYTDQSPPSA